MNFIILRYFDSLLRDCGDLGDRFPASVIIDKLILLAKLRGAGLDLASTQGDSDADANACLSAVTDTVQYLSMALGQLSIRKDCLETLYRAGTSDLHHQRDFSIADSQLKAVWTTALAVQECLWVDLAAASHERETSGADISLGMTEEAVIFSTVLGRLAAECRQSITEDLLRGDICPSIFPVGDRDSTRGDRDREGVYDGALDIEAIIETLNFSDNLHSQRIGHLVRGCF